MAKCKVNDDLIGYAKDYRTLGDRVDAAIAGDHSLREAMQESGANDLIELAHAMAYAALRSDACVVVRAKTRKK